MILQYRQPPGDTKFIDYARLSLNRIQGDVGEENNSKIYWSLL